MKRGRKYKGTAAPPRCTTHTLSTVTRPLFSLSLSATDWLLHSRPMLGPTTCPLSVLESLVQPLAGLDVASKPDPAVAARGASQRTLPLGEMVGIPIMQYRVGTESVELVGIQLTEK